MVRRLAHLCFNTDRLEVMKDFYSRVLGLPVKFIFQNKDADIFGYYFDCGDSSFIEIFDRTLKRKQWGGADEPLRGGTRYAHFCLEVTDLKNLKPLLEQRGAKIGEIRTGMDGSFQAWTNDPDGNAIELMEYTVKSQQVQRHAEPQVIF